MAIKINLPTPTKPGLYLYLWRSSNYKKVELIEVYEVPEGFRYGAHWDAYLAVEGMNGRAVNRLAGWFSKPLEVVKGSLRVIPTKRKA